MSDLGDKPRVNVEIEYIAIKPGETITLLVIGPDGTNASIEVRSVGVPGSGRGVVQVFCDEKILFSNFDDYKPMHRAVREQYGIGVQRLDSPVPAKGAGDVFT
jgi:hypothetical protein